ncbi:MAG: D-glycero-beta-D-manno-heptose 1-phosphate adenylyltransferase [Cyclobacteriaceae bacterium]
MTPQRSHHKILTDESLPSALKEWRDTNQKIVFTNGCFDLLHVGHVDYLEKSRLLGDKLIVGLNTDLSVKGNKGDKRPVNNEQIRSIMLSALWFVDAVILFGDKTPLKLIDTVRPDILVKGKDYEIEEIVGSKEVIAYGGAVERIDLVNGFSTTNLIEKIKDL